MNREDVSKEYPEKYAYPDPFPGKGNLFAIANDASRKEWASEVPLDLPILIISGALDPVGLNGLSLIHISSEYSRQDRTGQRNAKVLHC